MSRWCVRGFLSRLFLLALVVALAGCGRAIVPAPVITPQSPYGEGNLPPPPGLPPGPLPEAAPGAGGPVKVALLVPLSGPNAELGKAMLEAAQLALFETGADRLTLVPRDTGGTAPGAAGAARAVLAEGVRLILGPLLAAEVEAVAPLARTAKVNVIAFSTATQLAGGNVFLIGFLPRQEIVRVAAFARERGLGRFVAVAPNSPYGHLAAETLREVGGTSGGTVARIEYFDPRATNLTRAIQRLMAASAAAGPGAAAPGPGAGFDALLLPLGGDRLKEIARQLREAGLDPSQVRFLGSGLWDDPAIAGEPALYGGWFAASPPEARGEFERRFRMTYHHDAPRLASLAFDAAAFAGVLVKSGGNDPFSPQAILNPAGFTGVDGLFRFTPQGLVERGLAVLEVGPQGNAIVGPAPRSFTVLGY